VIFCPHANVFVLLQVGEFSVSAKDTHCEVLMLLQDARQSKNVAKCHCQ